MHKERNGARPPPRLPRLPEGRPSRPPPPQTELLAAAAVATAAVEATEEVLAAAEVADAEAVMIPIIATIRMKRRRTSTRRRRLMATASLPLSLPPRHRQARGSRVVLWLRGVQRPARRHSHPHLAAARCSQLMPLLPPCTLRQPRLTLRLATSLPYPTCSFLPCSATTISHM